MSATTPRVYVGTYAKYNAGNRRDGPTDETALLISRGFRDKGGE